MPPRTPRPYAFSLLILLPVVASGCGDGSEPPPRAIAAVDTVDDVERYRYPEASGPALDWSADTALVLGDAFAEDAYQFDAVTAGGLAAADDGLLVLDRQGDRLLEYGPDGSHRATYGREGEGPGELSQPIGVDLGPGDTIWVSDFSNSRLTGYPRAGGEPRTVAFPQDVGFPSPRMAALDGGYLMQFNPMFNFRRSEGGDYRMSRGDGTEPERPRLPVIRYDRSLQPSDTLWSSVEPPTDMVQLETAGRLMVTLMSRTFYPELLWDAFSDGALVVSDTASYLLRLVAPDGTVRRVIERDPPPRTVTETDREQARARVRAEESDGPSVRVGGSGPGEEARQKLLEQRLEKMTFADLVPRVVALRVDPQDRIWVGVSEESAGELDRIDLYDREGGLLGELRDFPMPDVFLGGDRIGVLRRDEMDVQQVVVLNVRRPEVAGD